MRIVPEAMREVAHRQEVWSRLGIAAPLLGARPALVGEAVVPFVGQNQMVEERNAE